MRKIDNDTFALSFLLWWA